MGFKCLIDKWPKTMKLIYFIIKMNAVIKLSNTQYLKVMEELLLMKIQIND